MQLYTADQTRKIDNLAIKRKNTSGYSLMQEAAEFSLNVLMQEYNDTNEIIVFCAKGKNSGDGFLLASFAKEFGLSSYVVMCAPTKDLSGVCKKAFQTAKDSGVKIINLGSLNRIKVSKKAVLVDALIGTGLKGTLRTNIKKSILAINKLSVKYPVVSLDIPSGICPDSGTTKDICVIADITTTFVAQKRGCFTSQGRAMSGEIFYSDLKIPKSVSRKIKSNCHLINMEDHLHKLILRDQNSHKGNFGHALIIGGNNGFGGAAILAAKAAAFSGAGLIGLATKPEHINASLVSCPEVMAVGIHSGQDLETYLEKPDVIAIGPGLGQTAWSEQLLQRVFLESGKRNVAVVLDADALNLLSSLKLSAGIPKNLIITPHPGEAARLLSKSIKEIEADRFKAVSLLQEKFNAVVVLKGSGTLVGYKKSGKQHIGVCGAGNPGMATGGMGDILTGIIASFLAQGLLPHEAAETGVDIHAKSSDLKALEIGEVGLLPNDVLNEVRLLLKYD
ncbi:MAG: bifunctional ADP-dependent NAD(P)H-hydrate dehydratase/NAD(P)H-hydrate epimerase [Gammaproteobacteria bacterium]|nr:bifunctional ADP-dependent NAD(P)H-hydrate dehydratase/NAD(P)H-hydrate epimerase [Gammaproteobacteria bacterium]